MFAIYKKELRSYFLNAIGYVYVGVFLAVSAILCCFTTLSAKTYDTTDYFTYIIFSFTKRVVRARQIARIFFMMGLLML